MQGVALAAPGAIAGGKASLTASLPERVGRFGKFRTNHLADQVSLAKTMVACIEGEGMNVVVEPAEANLPAGLRMMHWRAVN